MPEFSGIDTLKSLRAHNVSSRNRNLHRHQIMKMMFFGCYRLGGADGYLLKDMEPEDHFSSD